MNKIINFFTFPSGVIFEGITEKDNPGRGEMSLTML